LEAQAKKFCSECGEAINPKAEICPKCGVRVAPAPANNSKSRDTAGLLALFLGGLGAHKFYLGNTKMGIIYILFCWTFIPAIIGFFEAIQFFRMPHDVFHARYG